MERQPAAEAVCLLQSQTESVIAFLSNETSVKQLRQDKAYNLQLLQQQFQIGPPQIEALYFYAKFQFDCGSYSDAAETLFHCRCSHCQLFLEMYEAVLAELTLHACQLNA